MTGPPADLVRALIDGPSFVAAVEWHEEIDSTNATALAAARAGAPEGHLVLADRQTSGRGRLGRVWSAPPGTSLLLSVVLRPVVRREHQALLPLVTGLALADATAPFVPDAQIGLKWPNDLLVDGGKAAGILVESAATAVVVGIGLNVDWRDVRRPAELAGATSLAEQVGAAVDRWRVLAAITGVLGNRYRTWQQAPPAFLPAYRRRCATIGQRVRVSRVGGEPLEGLAEGVGDDGRLTVVDPTGRPHVLAAGDVEHVRPA